MILTISLTQNDPRISDRLLGYYQPFRVFLKIVFLFSFFVLFGISGGIISFFFNLFILLAV